MKLRHILALIALIAALPHTKAESLTNYDLKIGDFTELRVSDGINVDYRHDDALAGKARFKCPSQMASAFMFTNKGGKLTVQLSPESMGIRNLPTIQVYSRYLTKVENTADSTVRVLSIKDCPKLEAKLEGNGRLVVHHVDANEVKGAMRLGHGTLVISGKCRDAKFDLTGTGVIQADDLEAENVQVNAKGTGSVGVCPEKTLSVFGLGSTTVYYTGSPEIKNRSMGIKLSPLSK